MAKEVVSCLDHCSFLEIHVHAEDEVEHQKVIIERRFQGVPLPCSPG